MESHSVHGRKAELQDRGGLHYATAKGVGAPSVPVGRIRVDSTPACWVRRMFVPLRPHHLSDFEMGFLGLQNVVLGFAMDVVRER